MGCTSAKQVSAVPSGGEESQSKAHSNGEIHSGRGQHVDDNSGANGKILSIHSSESQQEFFRMLDEKIEKGRDYCSEGEDLT
ncbi:hypothetical protein CRUP_033354 [Coryphaenoides rupestris]|nr:hypothetical protein CRUP_033354 [Coryphaenoides rupestris]